MKVALSIEVDEEDREYLGKLVLKLERPATATEAREWLKKLNAQGLIAAMLIGADDRRRIERSRLPEGARFDG